MPSRVQLEILADHKAACQDMGVAPVLFAHRTRLGTIETTVGTGNTQYKSQGPVTTLDDEFTETHWVWWIHQAFIRGLERPENFAFGIADTPWEQCQMAALDIYGNTMNVEEEDFIVDAQGFRWRMFNLVISPDQGYWSFMSQKTR